MAILRTYRDQISFFFTQFTNAFAKYKVFFDVNSEKAKVLSTFNDMRIGC